jgi:hypothetical protein
MLFNNLQTALFIGGATRGLVPILVTSPAFSGLSTGCISVVGGETITALTLNVLQKSFFLSSCSSLEMDLCEAWAKRALRLSFLHQKGGLTISQPASATSVLLLSFLGGLRLVGVECSE